MAWLLALIAAVLFALAAALHVLVAAIALFAALAGAVIITLANRHTEMPDAGDTTRLLRPDGVMTRESGASTIAE